ncbi:MAG: hypothetical protein ACJAZA_000115 [Shewanella psychromarinicola]|jgi:hypothetical protein
MPPRLLLQKPKTMVMIIETIHVTNLKMDGLAFHLLMRHLAMAKGHRLNITLAL